MNYHDYTSVATHTATPSATPTSASHTNGYYYPLSSSSPYDTTSTGYIVTHQHTPSVVTYSADTTNATDTTTIIDTSSYSFSTSANDQQHNFQHAHNGYSLYQQQQQQEEDGTLALNHIQMASNWQNQAPSATSMITTDPHFTTLNNDEELLVPFPERGVAGFVCKLYQSLEAPDGGEKYAHWCHHNGKDMFIIDCIPKFTETVLPKLFKHCKFASFVRQLNIYGFQRDTDARKSKDSKDKEICRWYHTHFRPGRRDLFHLIRRKAPRYSRRKRIKMDQDEEKISLHSGEDSDQDNGNINLHQSSPNTSAATTPTMKNMMYSSPTSMFQNDDGSADSSPTMVSPPPPLPPTSTSSATLAASDSPSPQQSQSVDHASASILSIHNHQQQLQQLGNPSSALLLTHQLTPFQHQNQSDMQQQQDSNSSNQQQQQQQQQGICNSYQHSQHHETPTSLCLTSPLGLDNPLRNGGSTQFMEESQPLPPPPAQQQASFQSHQLQQIPPILHSSQQQLHRASSSSSTSDPLPQQSHHPHHQFQLMQQQLQRSQHQPNHQLLSSMGEDPNMYPIIFQAPAPTTSPTTSSSSFYQEELKAHITRLQHEYQQMHTYFTNELGKAHEQIKSQRLRSEYLERSLRGEQ